MPSAGEWSGRPPGWARQQRTPGRGFGQPWYDSDCRTACKAVRAALRAAPRAPATRELRARYRRLLRRKRAAYLHPQAAAALKDLMHNPRRFWRARGARPAALPACLDNGAASHFERMFAVPPAHGPAAAATMGVLAAHRRGTPLQAAALGVPITDADVVAELQKLRNGTASGPAGIPPKFFRLTRTADEATGAFTYVLAPAIADVFATCFTAGRVPDEWQRASITLLRKRPAPGAAPAAPSFDTVRPIAVGSVLPKLYARVLNTRLVKWAEEHGKHAAEQAGFRPGMGTENHLFHLNHVRDVVRSSLDERPAFLAFVDLAKAYDRVSRDLLWEALAFIGVQGPFLAALQSLYADVRMAVQLPSGPSQLFPCRRGLRQGCPLSPTLFTLFFDHLADYLRRNDVLRWQRNERLRVDEGVPILAVGGERPLRALFFADDVVLIARSRDGLQALLKRLQIFCERWQLEVNVAKTKAMVVRHPLAPWQWAEAVRYGHQPLEWVDSYKYLGVTFHREHGFAGGATEAGARAQSGLGRLSGYMGRHPELRKSLALRQRLFDTLALPGCDYGCLVWALPWLRPLQDTSSPGWSPAASPAELVQKAFCQQLLNAPKWVATEILYREAGREPLPMRWVRAICRFWNVTVTAPRKSDTLSPWVLDANIRLWRERASGWTCAFAEALASIWPRHTASTREQLLHRCCVSGAGLADQLRRRYDTKWAQLGDPRDPDVAHRPHATYRAWHWPEPVMVEGRETYLFDPNVPHHTALQAAAMRIGGKHSLHVNTGRYSTPYKPFSRRTCPRCQEGVEDTAHVLFECAAEPLQAVRQRYAALLGSLPHPDTHGIAATCRALSCVEDQEAMAGFLAACYRAVHRRGPAQPRAARRRARAAATPPGPEPAAPAAQRRRRTGTAAPASAAGALAAPRRRRGGAAAAPSAAAARSTGASQALPLRRSQRAAAAHAAHAIARLADDA